MARSPDPGEGDDDASHKGGDDESTTTSAGATNAIASRGCSCDATGARSTGTHSMALLVVMLVLGRRRRRAAAPHSKKLGSSCECH